MKRIVIVLVTFMLLLPSYLFALEAVEARKKLMEMGVEYTIGAFSDSIRKGDLAVVNLFLDAGMDVNSVDGTGRPALIVAAGQANAAILTALIEKGADVKVRQKDHEWTPLMEAAAEGRVDTVRELLKRGADVNAHDVTGVTALMEAVKKNSHGLVAALLAARADVNLADAKGQTALMEAATRGCDNVIP